MNKLLRKSIIIFFSLMILIALPLFLLPLNLFDGEIIHKNGISTIIESRPMSLHFVSGLEYGNSKPNGIVDYYLTPKGYLLSLLFLVGLPLLLAYRIYLGGRNK